MRTLIAAVGLLFASVDPAFAAAGEGLRDEIPMPAERKAEADKELGRRRGSKPDLDKSKVELRFEFTLSEPASRADLESLSAGVPARHRDALLEALLGYAAPEGSKEVRASGCCVRARYRGCVYLCCGSRDSSCGDSCRLLYCEAR